jgi:hypothetical protein
VWGGGGGAKWGALAIRIKTTDINRDEIFQKNSGIRTFLTTKGMKKFLERLKVEPVAKKLRRYKSNWLQHGTRMNNNRMPKIMLMYRPNGLGRLLKRLLDEGRNRSIKA